MAIQYLYLVQHGEAKPEQEDPERPLTEKGRKDVEVIATEVAKRGLKINKILHSGKLRARQTAEIFAQKLSVKNIEELKSINPLDDPAFAKEIVENAPEDLMIVGHLPHLGKLVSLLVVNNPEKEIVKFQMGGMLGLKKIETNWIITCFFTPCI